MKKFGVIIIIITIFLGLSFAGYLYFQNKSTNEETKSPIPTPFVEEIVSKIKYDTDLAEKETLNILLLGIDRRSRAELGYRTDIMILLSINTKDNIVVMTSVPRDLWYDSGRINATYVAQGWEGIQAGFEEVTGLKPDRFILTDFADFAWIVDAMGGVPVDVQTTFTDHTYPIDATKGIQTVSFTAGEELMTGERALIFSRSRKGDFDNGDWGRMKRQHLLLKGMLNAVEQPESLFNPMVVEEAFKTVTTGKMDTNVTLSDAKFLWDFYKDKDLYTIESLYLDHDYLFTPPMSEYGGAWVLAPTGGSYSAFHEKLNNTLHGIEPEPPVTEETTEDITEQPENAEDETL